MQNLQCQCQLALVCKGLVYELINYIGHSSQYPYKEYRPTRQIELTSKQLQCSFDIPFNYLLLPSKGCL